MQGISVYERKGRLTYHVAYNSAATGKRVSENTGFLISDSRGKLKAYAYARDKSHSGTATTANDKERYDVWAEAWLRTRYRTQQKTLTSYLGGWKQVSLFLRENNVPIPRLLAYQHVIDFVHWREAQVKKQSGRKVSRNTALHNVKVLSRVQREAIKRGYAQGNPCLSLGDDVPRDPVPEKPEFTDEQISAVRAELARRQGVGRPSDWMQIAFEIALHQGCRLSATQIPMERIDFARWTITFHEKGRKGQPAVFTVPVHPGLRPLLLRLRAEKRKVTCELPRFAPRNFGRVMHAMGLPHTFHCTRVSVITRMARNNVTPQKAMGYVHHANWAIHKIYTRLKPTDVEGVPEALALPPPVALVAAS
jgi:integrase